MILKDSPLHLHKKFKGKIEIQPKIKLTAHNLPLLYTPGVASVALEIAKDPLKALYYTNKGNSVAIVTDGSRLLGLGNQGPYAALPVMEGKALLFKELGGIDAYPVCLDTQDPEKIIETVKAIAPSFRGINLEDIASPKCFFIERTLKKELDIPVFHDDQHGTAIVALAALINALKIVKKTLREIKVIILGAGAAGLAIAHLLLDFGVDKIFIFDSTGSIYKERKKDMNPFKEEIASRIRAKDISFKKSLINSDVFIGVSGKSNILSKNDFKGMNKDSIVFTLSNPEPEISYKDVKGIARICASGGGGNYKNHVNNLLSFPFIWRGALDAQAAQITKKMIMECAKSIADFVKPDQLNENHILPGIFEKGLLKHVAGKVKEAV